jgi:Ca-activated chloride channel family protein
MTFIWPRLLFALFAIPVLAFLYLRRIRGSRHSAERISPMGMATDAAGRNMGARRHLPQALMLLGLGFLLFGLARPQMTVELPHIEGTVILAFDVSNSMSANDIQPTRLEAAKAAARSFVQKQPTTIRLGVVAFGGNGLIMQAPTNNQAAVLAAIDRLTTQGGTSLGQGIFTSLNAIAGKALAFDQATAGADVSQLRIDKYSSAVVILMTDGENTDRPDPVEIAQIAAEAGVRVYGIGLGTPQGATINVDGFNIVTQLDEPMLEQIANVTNGAYYPAQDAADLQSIYDKVDLHLTTRGEQMEITSLIGGLSILLLLIGGTLSVLWFGRVP